jgi:hypothetical protein
MAFKPLPDLSYLKECFEICPDSPSGLRWRKDRPQSHFSSNMNYAKYINSFAGAPAGSRNKRGYYAVHVMGKSYANNRIIYSMHHDLILEQYEIDHIDRNPSNNLVSNLRIASHEENLRNVGPRVNNSSGVPGVTFRNGLWRARIMVNYKEINLGYFKLKEEAFAARRAANDIYHADFTPKTFEPQDAYMYYI